jgi:CHAT domain-containing protein/tetratricopeptide (TPR) repeat protein
MWPLNWFRKKRLQRAEDSTGWQEQIDRLNREVVQLYQRGKYGEAITRALTATELARRHLGEDHPDFATSLNNLAELYRSMGDYAQAEPLYRQASEIWRVALGEGHPDFAASLNNLAALYQSMGDYAQAEPLYRQALEIRRVALGEGHSDFATSLNNLAGLCAGTERAKEAFALMLQAAGINDRLLGQVFAIGSDSQRMAFLDTIRGKLDGLLSLVHGSLGHSPEAVLAALDLVLRRKALAAEAQAAQRDAVLGGAYPHLQSPLHEWSTLRAQITRKRLAGPGPEGAEAHEQELHRWEAQREQLEAALARKIPEMNLQRRLQAADRRAVALALPEGVALVEFVRFDVFDFKAVPARGERLVQPARYLAFVLPARDPDAVQMIDLGEAEPIDALIELFREGVNHPPDDSSRNMVPLPAEEEVPAWQQAGRDLYERLIAKLQPALGGKTRLFLCPDGSLARLPFGLLPDTDGRLLMDTHTISYVGSGRDVLRFGAASTGTPTAPLVVANPDFDLGERGPGRPGSSPPSRTWSLRQTLQKYRPFQPLPGTAVEGERIAASLGVKPWQGRDALEGPFKQQCRSPRILHLATHGFALDEERPDPNAAGRGLRSFGEALAHPGPRTTNPLLRAGLALAGVNTWVREGTLPEEAEDGILTAEDVSGLNLLATELVVLSACETGLGEVKTGEGVFGLQRAFTLAGAKTLVMSLWAVDDETTRELMEDFYQRLHNGEGRAAALHNAQQALRKKHPHAYYWGAFICQGNPDPLPAV